MIVVDGDLAVVVADDAVHDRQSQSRSAALRREVRQEQPFLVFGGDAAAGT